MSARRAPDGPPEEIASRLKERVYVTFTALAVVLALRAHDEPAGAAAATLIIVVVGTLLAVFVADVVSHIAVHEVLPTRPQFRRMVRISFGAFSAVLLPFVFLGLAAAGVWQLHAALRGSTIALVSTLAAIGYLAARRLRLPKWKRAVVLLAEVVLGFAVVGLELLAHG